MIDDNIARWVESRLTSFENLNWQRMSSITVDFCRTFGVVEMEDWWTREILRTALDISTPEPDRQRSLISLTTMLPDSRKLDSRCVELQVGDTVHYNTTLGTVVRFNAPGWCTVERVSQNTGRSYKQRAPYRTLTKVILPEAPST